MLFVILYTYIGLRLSLYATRKTFTFILLFLGVFLEIGCILRIRSRLSDFLLLRFYLVTSRSFFDALWVFKKRIPNIITHNYHLVFHTILAFMILNYIGD